MCATVFSIPLNLCPLIYLFVSWSPHRLKDQERDFQDEDEDDTAREEIRSEKVKWEIRINKGMCVYPLLWKWERSCIFLLEKKKLESWFSLSTSAYSAVIIRGRDKLYTYPSPTLQTLHTYNQSRVPCHAWVDHAKLALAS